MKNALLLTLHVTYRNVKPLKEGTGVFNKEHILKKENSILIRAYNKETL